MYSTNHGEQMKFMKSTLPVLALSLLVGACSESGSSSNGGGSGSGFSQNEIARPDGSNVDGNYAAEIWPVNYNLHFKTLGMVGVKREGDMFEAMINMKYAPKSTAIRSAIYTARRCPTIQDDLNKDAYIDILEARLAIGKVTIPFDSDLDSQMSGYGDWPSSDASGKLMYHESASWERLFADLKTPDADSTDQMVKLGDTDGITFPGRIVLFQGLDANVTLPESVATTDGLSAHQSIPVGCAVLWKVQDMPAELQSMTTTP